MPTTKILEFLDAEGRSPFGRWFDRLNAPAAAKIAAALYQLAAGNHSNVKGVGSGVFERKIDLGPGYRIYFGKDGDSLFILLGGSTKQRQQQEIKIAKDRWMAYRRRKGI